MPGVSEASALDAVRRMTARMHTRGPDAEGVWASEGVVLGHRRLAILDLDARANQPMVSTDGRYTIVFNGEIYNFHELRRELAAEGIAFRTTSDTEVLLALFAREGERMLPRLRGMFAFAIWDTQTRELFLARDPYGIKPLYYTRTKDGFVFASQVKALLASGLVATEREPAGLVGFYLWGSVPEPWTLFHDVFALPAGHWLRVRAGVPAAPVSLVRHPRPLAKGRMQGNSAGIAGTGAAGGDGFCACPPGRRCAGKRVSLRWHRLGSNRRSGVRVGRSSRGHHHWLRGVRRSSR